MKTPIKNVSTNIITGFLGVGKTTAILELISTKPKNERWAILINEAGKVGIDGSVISQPGIYTKQISGGCMCCASGLPMQAAITNLLRESRPHRLLIEPSGIGHPRKIQKTLCIPEYTGVLNIKANMCLIDPRHLSDPRYRESQMFQDQISVADIVIANKIDLCNAQQEQNFDDFALQLGLPAQHIKKTSYASIDSRWLDSPHQEREYRPLTTNARQLEYSTLSKSYPDTHVFDEQELCHWIKSLNIERVKAIVKTENGNFLFNSVEGSISVSPISQFSSNRIELISSRKLDNSAWDKLEKT